QLKGCMATLQRIWISALQPRRRKSSRRTSLQAKCILSHLLFPNLSRKDSTSTSQRNYQYPAGNDPRIFNIRRLHRFQQHNSLDQHCNPRYQSRKLHRNPQQQFSLLDHHERSQKGSLSTKNRRDPHRRTGLDIRRGQSSNQNVQLSMMPIGTTQGRYIAINSIITSITILENNAAQLQFSAVGESPTLIMVSVPSKPLTIALDGKTINNWTYNSTTSTIAIQTSELGSFTINPQFILAGGNDSFTATASGGLSPYKFNWTFGDSPLVANGSFVTHIFSVAGSYTVTLNITDSTPILPMKTAITNTVTVHGSPLNINGWSVNWNITAFHGVEIYNSSYNGVLTIRDALIKGVSVVYFQQPPGLSCLFFDDLGRDDLEGSIAGFTVQNSTDPSNPWFQIRANFNPSLVGYNYTQFWRFYKSGEWDATLYVGHIGCGWNHYYQPHYRIDLAAGNKNRHVMSQYAPSGVWRNLIWEGN